AILFGRYDTLIIGILQLGVMALMALIGWLNGLGWGYYWAVLVDGWLQAEQPRVRMIMQVHDELVFEVHKDDLDAVSKRIHQLM
ncbi:DNA polymerase, partial [Salmonella enterica subsp. enterica serovar Montevideo]|nr:DNA polymerase [Salmonella enterica subsp. enterica serovar Montevideo]